MKLKRLFILFFIITLFITNNYIYASNKSDENIDISAESAILIDSSTKKVLYSKNSNKKMYPASTTKILTAIITIENCGLTDLVTVQNSAISAVPSGYSTANLVANEQLTIKDLLTVLLVPSANDVANVIAEHISGSFQDFAELMNKKASELGCQNSHFTNPSGMHNDNHYTTAEDMAKIATYCMKNQTFRELVSLKKCKISSTNKSGVRTYSNTNELINPSSKYYLENCIGIKTGYTSEAKNCLISACNKDNLELICVVLGSSDEGNNKITRFTDSKKLYNFGYSNFSIKTIANKYDKIDSIQISNGTKDTRNLELILANDVNALVNNSESNINPVISLNENLSAPISENDVLGTINYNIDDITYTENLLASHSVEVDTTWISILQVSLSVLIILILLIIFSKSKKKYKRKKRYNKKY